MPYNKKVWEDRTVERPMTFIMQNNADGTITLIPSEGSIIKAGTPITADNMNNIENGIDNAVENTGDTMTGTLMINRNGGSPLILAQADYASGPYNYIGFADNNGAWKSYLGWSSAKDGKFRMVNSLGDILIQTTFVGGIVDILQPIKEEGELLKDKYVSKKGDTITTTGASPLVLYSTTNKSKIRFTSTTTDNYIQSGDDLDKAENLYISGYNATMMEILYLKSKITHIGNKLYMNSDTWTFPKEILRYTAYDANGGGLSIGAGGTTVIGGGEAAHVVIDNTDIVTNAGVEQLILAADAAVRIISNVQTIASRKEATFTTAGVLQVPTIEEGGTSLATKYAAKSHTHTIANVTNLQTELDKKLNLAGGQVTGTIDIVGDLQYKSVSMMRSYKDLDGALVMQRASTHIYGTTAPNANFLISIHDTNHAHYYIIGIGHFQNNSYFEFTKLAGNQLTYVTNTLGTISVTGGAGPYRFTIHGLGGLT